MNWRRIVLFGLVALFGVIFITQIGDITELIGALRQGRPIWIVIALAVQLLWFLNQVALYQSLYRLLDLPARIRQLLPIVLASNFVNFATPTASLGAVPLFVDDAQQRGLDAGRVTLTNVLRLLLNLLWFSLLLAFSLTMLYIWHRLKTYHIIAASILLATALLMAAGLVLAGWWPDRLARLLAWLAKLLNRLGQRVLHRDLLTEERASDFAHEFGAAAGALWAGRSKLARPWLHVMFFDVLEMVVLYITLLAFPSGGEHVSLAMLVTAYSIGVLFSVVAITPQGVGAVEGLLVAAFMSLGLPMGRAAVVVLAYRGMSFWLPLLVGFAALRWVRGIGKPSAEPGTETEIRPDLNSAANIPVK